MARYSPLPSVPIDPRNEAQLVQAAAQKVYEASNRTLNDFSAGNPLAVLLEGQAFAQGEFLYWANQLPEKILIEWIGPFLGAMRRLGTPAATLLQVTIPPSKTETTLPAGSIFSTNSQLTSGESYEFVSSDDLVIPAGDSVGEVPVYSKYVGTIYNVPSNTITGSTNIGLTNFSVTNPQPAVGGSDVETFQEVQERFFTLLRRRNPVSESDWQDFFTDLFGVGTLTSVQPNRTSFYGYNYDLDYQIPNGQVSFFVLGPNGTELTEQQLTAGQNAINYSLPIENRAYLYPITLSQVQYNLTLEVDANGSFGSNYRESSLNFRDRLFSVLTPGNVFPADVNPTVSDIDAAFYSTFDSATRFRDPTIEASVAYNTPSQLSPNAATYTNVYDFEPTEYLLTERDLVVDYNPNPTFYPVDSSFTPYSTDKFDQTVYGNLSLKQIKFLTAGSFNLGDIVYYDGAADLAQQGLHVILENLNISSSSQILPLIASGRISGVKTFQPWVVGNSYVYETDGTIDPDIIEYDYTSGEFIPNSPPSAIPLNSRPGGFAWLVSQNFTLQPETNDISGAQLTSAIGSSVVPTSLETGSSYSAGTWVCTPQVGSGPSPIVDPFYNYVDVEQGAIVKYAYVISSFTFAPNELTVSQYFDDLVTSGTLQEVQLFDGSNGLPVYKYRARFKGGQYLLYKESSGSAPKYYIASSFFTPSSTNIRDLLADGSVYDLAPTPALFTQLLTDLQSEVVTKDIHRMFTFFLGDRTFFREGSDVLSFTATSAVTPLFNFDVYLNNGVFIKSDPSVDGFEESSDYIPYYSPEYVETAEDTILSEDGRNLYRVMKAFTPQSLVTSWTGIEEDNTARYEEYRRNLLRFVVSYRCEESVLSQYGTETSSIKLGSCQISVIPKNYGRSLNSSPTIVYVWENTANLEEVPQLSWYSESTFPYTPPDYKNGTLAL